MIKIKDLKEMFKIFANELGYECSDDLDIYITEKEHNNKELKALQLFQAIIQYLEEEKLQQCGWYD